MEYPRILVNPETSFFLFGARGTGKSTWLRQLLPEAVSVNLLDEGLYQKYLAEPGLFGQRMRALPPASWVVVDEVQRLPNLLNEVHLAMESYRHVFALCGSSARKLRRAGTNLLAGRALKLSMYPFVPCELGADFSLEKAMRFGTLPVVCAAKFPQKTLEAYAQIYLKEEIQAEALVRNLPGFARFLPVAAIFHGQLLNATSLARDCEVSRTTVLNYLEILEDTLLAWSLSAFEGKLRIREKRAAKLFFIDPGLVRVLRKASGSPSQEEAGHLFEGFVGMMLKAHNSYSDLFDDMFYWSPSEARHTEVDFLLQKGTEFIAIEVKSGSRVSESWFRGLRAIADLKGLKRRLLVYTGDEKLKTTDGIEVFPLIEFSKLLQEGML